MELDSGSLMFNMNISGKGGTPSWGTSIAEQGAGEHKYYENCSDIITGLLFNKIDEYTINDVGALGKGGRGGKNYKLVIAGLFKKIFVNDQKVDDAEFVLAIIEQEYASKTNPQHKGRKTLKYKVDSKYKKKKINEDCYKKIGKKLGVINKKGTCGAWFVSDINVVNQDELHFTAYIASKSKTLSYKDANERKKACNEIKYKQNNFGKTELNKIFTGIPGCGKSYYIENKLLGKVNKGENVFRTTFYPDYSNSDFIGQLMPTMEKNNKGEEVVKYKRIPGPFTQALERALSTDESVYLVIEEINRGNAPAIFGDVFQLLDRRETISGKYALGDSEYPVTNEFIDSYLSDSKEKNGLIKYHNRGDKIYIPHNLIIYATMNTSDQNVMPLDTAFVRRWKKEPVQCDWNEVDKWENKYIPFFNITWRQFANTMNEYILKGNINGQFFSEDKLFGPYFISQEYLVSEEIKKKDFADPTCDEKYRGFVNNVIDYLYNDATKFNHEIIFNENIKSYHNIYDGMIDNDEYRKIVKDGYNQERFGKIMDAVFTQEVRDKLTKENNEK